MATQLQELEVDAITRGHLEKGLASLESEFAGVFSRETIERYMAESLEALAGSRLKDFVPLFVHRFARERLRALGQVEGTITKDVPEVLFVCVQNAGRSQMAAGLLDQLRGRAASTSARPDREPADQVNPHVVEAMAEVGVDISKEFPKPMTDEVVRAADAVITMGCGDACPIYPGKRYEDWEVDDPAGRRPRGREADPRPDQRARAKAPRRGRTRDRRECLGRTWRAGRSPRAWPPSPSCSPDAARSSPTRSTAASSARSASPWPSAS